MVVFFIYKGKPTSVLVSALMNENSGRDHSHRSSAHPNPRLGFVLLGFTKLVRNQSESSLIFISLHFPSLSARFNR